MMPSAGGASAISCAPSVPQLSDMMVLLLVWRTESAESQVLKAKTPESLLLNDAFRRLVVEAGEGRRIFGENLVL